MFKTILTLLKHPKAVLTGIPLMWKTLKWKLKGKKADKSETAYRKSVCGFCPLFTSDSRCNIEKLASWSGKTISLNEAKLTSHSVVPEGSDIIRTAFFQGELYYRGCGCNVDTKASYYFEDEDLDRKDGTAACPMGKWSKPYYKQWVKHGDASIIKQNT